MKTANTPRALLLVATLALGLTTLTALKAPRVESAPEMAAQTVTIVGHRMNDEQKLAFDLQSTGIQTVVISAKRLTPEQKIAMDEQNRAWQAAMNSKPANPAANG